jgi:FKBP-type peptidyl-prolyl cis-trans isomerase (trigger factor)
MSKYNVSLASKLKAHKQAMAEEAAKKPQRLVSEERARLIRALRSQLSNARVNSKSYLEANAQLNRIYIEEMELDEAFALEHAM